MEDSKNNSAAPVEVMPIPLYVLTITLTSSVLSLLGSSVIILTYLSWPDVRTTTRNVLFHLSVACFFSVCFLLPGIYDGSDLDDKLAATSWCVFESAFCTFFTTSSFLWTVALVIYLLITIRTVDYRPADYLLIYFHVACWGVPAVLVATALLSKRLGPTQNKTTLGWCWIDMRTKDSLTWMLLTSKAWELSAYVVLIILCILLKKQITKQCRRPQVIQCKGTPAAMKKICKKILFTTFVFILLRLFDSVRFVLAVCNSNYVHNHLLMTLQGIGNTSQGFVNFLLFCVCTGKIRNRFYDSISKKRSNSTEHQDAEHLLAKSKTVLYTN